MIKEMAVLAMFVSFGVVSPFCSVKAQVVPSIDVTPPEIVKNSQTSSTAFASLDDVSANADLFGPLAEMFKELAKPIGNVQRGSREIAIFRQAAPAVVLIKTKDGLGSGVVLQDGQIVTNRHVLQGIGAVEIIFKPSDGVNGRQTVETRVGRVQFVDPKRDLAIIAPATLPVDQKHLRLISKDDLDVGADVYAIGHPLGYTWTFTRGIVSGIRHIDTDGQDYTAIQTQTPISPGNSGGPLLNASMELVGVNTWARDISSVEQKEIGGSKVSLSRPAQGLNFAVSAQDIRIFLAEIGQGKIKNLALQLPNIPECSGKPISAGRAKSNDADVRGFSLKCDGKADAWLVAPDDKTQPNRLLLDPDRSNKISVIVIADVRTGKWHTSYWDFFRDRTFAVIGYHENGSVEPSRFEFSRT